MSRIVIKGTLSADVADAGTFTVGYPNALAPALALSTDEGDFYNTQDHQIVIGNNTAGNAPEDFGITLGTSVVTVTNKTGSTWTAGTAYTLHLEIPGSPVNGPPIDGGQSVPFTRMGECGVYLVNLGAPDAIVTNAVMDQQNRTNAGALVVNGTLAASGVVTLDRPRNVIVDSGGADDAVITITGKDEYGEAMAETITMNGTTAVSGKKAFKQISAISCSKAVANTAFIGTGDVLGLPMWLPSAGHVIAELENGTAATAGTKVAGWNTAGDHTATGADVRGTYDPNSACDGDKVFQLIVALPDLKRGAPQYTS